MELHQFSQSAWVKEVWNASPKRDDWLTETYKVGKKVKLYIGGSKVPETSWLPHFLNNLLEDDGEQSRLLGCDAVWFL
jgi:hypothetical protein